MPKINSNLSRVIEDNAIVTAIQKPDFSKLDFANLKHGP